MSASEGLRAITGDAIGENYRAVAFQADGAPASREEQYQMIGINRLAADYPGLGDGIGQLAEAWR